MLVYPIGSSGQALIFRRPVLEHFEKYKQRRFWQREAGGLLFVELERTSISIVEATGPRRSDKRGRHSYIPDRGAEQEEIFERHKRGLHFVGFWHTHPEVSPKPSPVDIASIADCFKKSVHSLNAFVLVIVGLEEGPKGIHVSLHDGCSMLVLSPAANQ